MKYELTNNTRFVPGFYAMVRVYQIRALRYIPMHGVKAGDLGGWVESEDNLSQEDDSWIGEYATFMGNSHPEYDSLVDACIWFG